MWFHSLLASWQSARSRGRRPRPARRGTRLVLEQLEDRALPSSYTANTATDLINDINAANAAGGANTITLAAPTTSPYVLTAVNNGTGGGVGGPNGLPVIAANDYLTIVGNGDTIERSTASSTPAFRLLDVGGSLTLENLTLQGGDGYVVGENGAGEAGGAIISFGTLVLNGVTVQNNSSIDGGGIYSQGGSVTLEGGTIVRNNRASAIGGATGLGGGLDAVDVPVTVTNSTLESNWAQSGGGLAVDGGLNTFDYAAVSLSNDTFEFNKALSGGGLYLDSFGTVNLSYDTVDSNTATGGSFNFGGGGLFVTGGTVTLANDTVKSNTTTYGYGGGLNVVGGNVTLANDTVESNSSGRDGGGLTVLGGTVTLSYDTVESNSAKLDGGGLYVYGYATKVTLANDTVEFNASSYGGGLYVYSGNVNLSYDTVESNSATSGGGGLYVYGGTVTLANDRMQSNTTTGYGGGIYIYPGATVYLDSITVANTINNTDNSGLNGSTANMTPAAGQPPIVVNAASASPSPVTGTTTTLNVLGADAAGSLSLTYTWAVTSAPAGAATPTFSSNAINAAQMTTATFYRAGTYTFQVTITDPSGLTAVCSVTVTVVQTPTSLSVTPANVTLAHGATQQFTATAQDQFGQALASQPTFTWQVSSGGGTISSTGRYTAPRKGTGTFQVTVSADGLNAQANVTVDA